MEVPMNSAQSGAHFPVQHRSLSLDIKVIVTQIGCMGTILAAKKDESVFSDPTYNVTVLFGKRDEVHHFRTIGYTKKSYILRTHAALYIHFCSGSGSARSLVISLGLKDHSQGTLKDIIAAVIENRLW